MESVRPHEHWPGAVRPLVDALAPRAIWTPGNDQLSSLVQRHSEQRGYELSNSPDRLTDVVVVSGDPNHHFVGSCLEAAVAPEIGGESGPPVIVVSATGWPHGDRDGYRDPDRIPAVARRAYARCLADPDELWLSAEVAELASALEPGGPANGVRPAVDALLAGGGWQARFLEGFGGLAVLAADVRLQPLSGLAEIWERLGDGERSQDLLRRLDLELGRAALVRARLEHALEEQITSGRELKSSLTAALDALDERLNTETESVQSLSDGLGRVGTLMLASAHREQRLEHRLTATEALAETARTELMDERRWIAQQAGVVARSQSWRVGHRLARTVWTLTFRRAKGDDALQRIIARMERGLGPGGS